MRKLLAVGMSVALSLSVTTGVFAQTIDKKTLSFEAATKVAAAAGAAARARGIGKARTAAESTRV